MKIKFRGYNCLIEKGMYSNGRIALELVDSFTEEPVATATVNLPDEEIEPDEVFIKSYSGNEGMYEALVEQGVISKKIKVVANAWVEFYLCKILI
jgi:hypothetical protein